LIKYYTNEKISLYIDDVQKGDSFVSVVFILLFSFVYGLVHAIGPGHGKSLVAAYVFSTNKDYQKALNISVLIGLVHAFSAFILTFLYITY